jgi:dehydrogenase/reductase SDR family protein 7
MAIDLVKSGAKVIISARRQDQLQEVANKCKVYGNDESVFIVPLDVLDDEAQITAYQTIKDKYGHIDVLVLNAGQSQRMIAMDTPSQKTIDLMNLNFFSYVKLTKIVTPDMIAQGSGHIVVMSSLAGRIGTTLSSSYSATKFALMGYYDAFRSEVAVNNIAVTMICPGPVESEITLHTIRDHSLPKQDEGAKMPTKRCTDLILKGMYYKLAEMWISEQPFLFVTYLNVYSPWLSRQLFTKVIGPSRISTLKDGGNIYDVKSNFGLK